MPEPWSRPLLIFKGGTWTVLFLADHFTQLQDGAIIQVIRGGTSLGRRPLQTHLPAWTQMQAVAYGPVSEGKRSSGHQPSGHVLCLFSSCSHESGYKMRLQPSCCWQPKARSGAGVTAAPRIFILQPLGDRKQSCALWRLGWQELWE